MVGVPVTIMVECPESCGTAAIPSWLQFSPWSGTTISSPRFQKINNYFASINYVISRTHRWRISSFCIKYLPGMYVTILFSEFYSSPTDCAYAGTLSIMYVLFMSPKSVIKLRIISPPSVPAHSLNYYYNNSSTAEQYSGSSSNSKTASSGGVFFTTNFVLRSWCFWVFAPISRRDRVEI